MVYEQNDNLSFLSCGIALWIENKVKNPERMFYSNSDKLAELGAVMRMQHKVLSVNIQNKTLVVNNLIPELFTISSPSTVSPRYHGRYCVFYFSPF